MLRPASLFALAALACCADALAVTRTWPGAAPCNASLQACINASAASDRVEVASNAVIDETLIVGVPMTLTNAVGYRPRLAADRIISANINAPGSWSVTLEGFTLERGLVQGVLSGGNGTIAIRRMHVLAANDSGSAQISLWRNTGATGTLSYDIAENRVDYAWNTNDGGIHAAIQVLDRETATSSGRIRHNHVVARGSWAAGILVATTDAGHTALVHNNTVLGGDAYGSIHLRQGHLVSPGGGSLTAIVVGNLVMPGPADAGSPQGIDAEAYHGALALQAFNNTVVGAWNGIDVYVAGGVAGTGRIANNLLAGNGSQISVSHSGTGAIGNDHNLLYGYVSPSVTPGAGTVTGDPRLRGMWGNPRLRADSPAIDAADGTALRNLLTSWNLPGVDADGLRRFKGGGASAPADIGAIEWGDDGLTHVASTASISGWITTVDHPLTNGHSGARLLGTPNFAAAEVNNDHPFGVYYSASRWHLYHEDTSAAAVPGEAFNLFLPAPGAGSFAHVSTAGNVSGWATRIDDAALNNSPDRIVLATRNWSAGSAIYNPHPLGVFYFAFGGPGAWYIANVDQETGGEMPVGIGFNVYAQEPSPNAFRVSAAPGNTSGSSLILDHPLLNGTPCARVHAARAHDGTPAGNGFDVYYSGGRWRIFGYGGMPAGASFHVVVDPAQVFECGDVIFADGFEP